MSDNYRHTGDDMNIHTLRKLANQEIVDYQFLISTLKEYSRPRDKISTWLKTAELIRIKKGLYVFGKEVAKAPYSKEILANLIYGPSAISLQYALAYYHLIPERVTTITSITHKRNKSFDTLIGHFTYSYLHPKKYIIGIELTTVYPHDQFLIASPEKALCDHIHITDKNIPFNNYEEIEFYLSADLRIDMNLIAKFKIKKLTEISSIYQDKRLDLLTQFIKNWKKLHA